MMAGSEGVSAVVGAVWHRHGWDEEKGGGGRGSDGFIVGLGIGRRGVEWSERVK